MSRTFTQPEVDAMIAAVVERCAAKADALPAYVRIGDIGDAIRSLATADQRTALDAALSDAQQYVIDDVAKALGVEGTTVSEIRAAVHALVGAAYEAAARLIVCYCDGPTPATAREGEVCPTCEERYSVDDDERRRALTPAHARAALDRVREEAREQGRAEGYQRRVLLAPAALIRAQRGGPTRTG